jgi:hypothetical protein
MEEWTMNVKLGLIAALLLVTPMGLIQAGEPNAQISDVIAQIESRRTDKTAAEAKSAQDRATEDKTGDQGARTRGGPGAGGGMKGKHGAPGGGENKN